MFSSVGGDSVAEDIGIGVPLGDGVALYSPDSLRSLSPPAIKDFCNDAI